MEHAYLVTYTTSQPSEPDERGVFICASKAAADKKFDGLVDEWKSTLCVTGDDVCDVDEPEEGAECRTATIDNGETSVEIAYSKQKVLS